MGKTINKQSGGRHEILTKKYQARKKDGGMVCNKCKKVRKLNEYGSNKSKCKKCVTKYYKKRYDRSRKSIW